MYTTNEVLFELSRKEIVAHFKSRAIYHLNKAKDAAERAMRARKEAEDMRGKFDEDELQIANSTYRGKVSGYESQAESLERIAADGMKSHLKFQFLAGHVINSAKQTFTASQLLDFEFFAP